MPGRSPVVRTAGPQRRRRAPASRSAGDLVVEQSPWLPAGGGASWTANGPSTLSYSSSAQVSGLIEKSLNNLVNYRDVKICTSTYREPTTKYALLTNPSSVTHVYNSLYCTYDTSRTYTKSSRTSSTISTGVNIIVVNVSAQSGFNSSREISWTMNSPGFLGGSNTGWASAHVVHAESGN